MTCLLPVLSKMCTQAEILDIWLITSKEQSETSKLLKNYTWVHVAATQPQVH